MIRAAGLLAALALAGCGGAPAGGGQDGGGQDGGGQDRAATAPDAAPTAAPPAGATGRVSDQVAPVGGLTGRVSALNANVSGLNTRMSDMGLVIDLPADVLFAFDEATLTPAAEGELKKATEMIRRAPAGPIRVIGHTDAKGEDAYNQRLSEARARAVADWFGGQVGVRTRAFDVTGRGEAAPIAPNARPDGSDDPAGRQKNRRVEVVVPTA